MLQRAHDARCVVVRALDVEGLAIAPEADRARPGPWSEVTSGFLEFRGRLEAQAPGVLDGPEHQVARQLRGRFQRLALVGGEEAPGERRQGGPLHDPRAVAVLPPQAPTVRPGAATPAPAPPFA